MISSKIWNLRFKGWDEVFISLGRMVSKEVLDEIHLLLCEEVIAFLKKHDWKVVNGFLDFVLFCKHQILLAKSADFLLQAINFIEIGVFFWFWKHVKSYGCLGF